MISSIKINIPQKKITSRWILPWLTPEIKRLCRRKKRAWDAGKHNRNSHSWKRFLKIRKRVKKSLEDSHRTYIDNILNTSINEDPKKFYSYIKQKKSVQRNIPILKSNYKLISDPKEVAKALNSQYTSQFTREPSGCLPDMEGQPVSSMPDIQFTVPGIEKLLRNLNPSLASGPDLVPSRILKLASQEIAPILCTIYQQSFNTGQVPQDWQQANVTAVFF